MASVLPANAPIPGANAVFPLQRKRSLVVPYYELEAELIKKRKRYIPGSAPSTGLPNSGCAIGYKRDGKRWHAGVDLAAIKGDPVVACDSGTIIRFRDFGDAALHTYALFVEHSGYIINYGEVDKKSLEMLSLKIGSSVSAGQQIGVVGKLNMIHFEMYESGLKSSWTSDYICGNQKWLQSDASPPTYLYNPTAYLLTLANKIDKTKYVEALSVSVCR
jgi:murein DD-endopeptidase MepM/ murein hydrolase activator NlpD